MANKVSKLPTIGIIGGGQLGKMFLENAVRYGNKIIVLENDTESPAQQLTHHYIKGSLQDAAAIRTLASKCDVLTFEIEHINTEVLIELEKEGKKIIPAPNVLKIIQDKGIQKQFYTQHGIPTSPYKLVNRPDEWLSAMLEMGGGKFAAKSRVGGYDGKGVYLTDAETIRRQPELIPFDGPVMIEKFVTCKTELAVIVAVAQDGTSKAFPCVDMEFDPISNLVTYLFSPAEIDAETEQKAQEIALQVVKAFGSPGLFAVEFFLDTQNQLYVNEIAPRPHNSGHHTIEGAYTSQFDQLFRILTGLPLGDISFRQAAVMINLVGPAGDHGEYYLKNLDLILEKPGVYIHMYGKAESRPDRKLGHITILGETLEDAKRKADWVRKTVSVAIIKN